MGIEAIHAASLVHDDLPALDNDDFRRGKPSCHKAFDEATAVLTGDLLFGIGFKSVCSTRFTASQKALLTERLADTWMSLCVGQQIDITGVSGTARERMLTLKTGALFACAAEWGAIAGSADAAQQARFRDWGNRLGVLFQWLDDLADGDGELVDSQRIAREKDALRLSIRELLPDGTEQTSLVLELTMRGT
jgi:geranylgeranyl pyrophosphate synthase